MLDEPNLEKDLLENETIKNKCRTSKIYPQNLYAAMANNRFFYGDKEWTCSWRYAGGIVANIVGEGDYMNYYCNGREGLVTDEVRLDLKNMGWIIKSYE